MPPAPKSLPGIPADYLPTFFNGDLVASTSDPQNRARVERCWGDEEEDNPDPRPQRSHPLSRPLLRGEVGIIDMHTGQGSLVPESTLRLINRDHLRGDIVKLSLTDAQSGVVVDLKSEVKLANVASGMGLRDWIPTERIKPALDIDLRDKVVFGNWVGTVDEVYEDGRVVGPDGGDYHIREPSGYLELCRAPPPDTFDDADHEPGFTEIRALIVSVTWHAINQMLPRSEQDKYPQPKRLWHGEDLGKLALANPLPNSAPMAGVIVKFKDAQDSLDTPSRMWSAFSMALDKRKHRFLAGLYQVTESRTTVRVRWQDGSETERAAEDLSPYRALDDCDTWPGDAVLWRSDNGDKRFACVQSVNARQRVADLYFLDDQSRATVPVLELDVGGVSRMPYGAPIGSTVLLTEDNGEPAPHMPLLGQWPAPKPEDQDELEALTRSMDDINASSLPHRLPEASLEGIDWWGEVVDLHLDGTVSVRVPNGALKRVGLKQCILLHDPSTADLMESAMGAMGADHEPLSPDHFGGDFDMDVVDGLVGHGSEGEGEWEDMEDVDPEFMEPGIPGFNMDYEPAPGFFDMMRRAMEDPNLPSEADQEALSEMYDAYGIDPPWITTGSAPRAVDAVEVIPAAAPNATTDDAVRPGTSEGDVEEVLPSMDVEDDAVAPLQSPPVVRPDQGPPTQVDEAEEENQAGPSRSPARANASYDKDAWKSFDVLEQAPLDHHYLQEKPAAAAKAYLSRLQKEHKTLMNALPENILVRTYEDRTDLMRVLIIGPEGTPYNNAPFVFDVYLPPDRFPHSPPVVFFHSHTNGHGRCNPNLYEEGKVCLSILGTWAGDSSESWNPKLSSLLQVFVSISGLVLVRHPYHCEPAFAKLEGTREGRINSRLYSEKAYVLSRSFVKQALQYPPSGLETEIRHFYIERGRLRAIIHHAQRLIVKGEAAADAGEEVDGDGDEVWNADAMGSLSMGAIIALKRTISALENLAADTNITLFVHA